MKEAIQFHAPDWELVLVWCVVALVSCVLVLWMGRLFGWAGALVTVAVVVAGATGLWLSVGPARGLYFMAFSLPLSVGALIGMVVWYVWLRR